MCIRGCNKYWLQQPYVHQEENGSVIFGLFTQKSALWQRKCMHNSTTQQYGWISETKCRSKTNVLSENSDSPIPFLQSSKTCETRQYIVQDRIHLWENCKEKDKEMINTKFRLLPPDGRDMQSSRRDIGKLQELIMSALLSKMVGIWMYYYYFTDMFYMDEMFLI